MRNSDFLNQATGGESGGNTGGGIEGFFNAVTAWITAILLGTFFWPLLIPLAGTGQNFEKVTPLNWVLEVLWLCFVVWLISTLVRKRRRRRNQQIPPQNGPPPYDNGSNRTYW